MEVYDELIKALKEIKRLENILNELEKESYLGMIENRKNNDYEKGLYCAYKHINHIIKERWINK